MSTKIYNAYKWKGNHDQLGRFIRELRKSYIDYAVETIYLKRALLYTLKEGEKIYLSDDKFGFFDLFDLLKRIVVDHIHMRGLRASVAVFHYRDLILVQFFGFGDLYRDAKTNNSLLVKIQRSKMLQDFHYQNQTDPYFDYSYFKNKHTQEEIKEAKKEWGFRRRVWDSIYSKGVTTPAEAGLVAEMGTHYSLWEIAQKYMIKYKEKG